MAKRLIALLLSMMMIVTLLPTGVFAAGTEVGGETSLTENIDHTWYTLSGVNSATNIIESEYNNACVHESCTAIADGVAKCDNCGENINGAPTVISGAKELSAMQADEEFTVPVVITNNPGLVGITLSVDTSENVKLKSASVDGTLFDGTKYGIKKIVEIKDKIVVINRAGVDGNVTDNGTIVNLTFTALSPIATGETVSIKVTATDTAATNLSEPTVYSGLNVVYGIESPARVNFDSLNFTVGNTLALNVKLTCNMFADEYTDCNTWTVYLDVETGTEWKQLSFMTINIDDVKVTGNDANATFSLAGIPAAYIVNNLKVRFVGNGNNGVTYKSEKDKMDLFGEKDKPISFVNYSAKVKDKYSKDTYLKKLLNSILNYAAAVQNYKSHKTDNLANNALTKEEKEVKSVADQDYNWNPYDVKRSVTPSTEKDVKITHSQLLLKSDKVGFRFYFTANDVSNLTAKVTDAKSEKVIQSISVFTKVSEGRYYAMFDGFGPTSFDTPIKVTIWNGNEQVSNTACDSIPGMAFAIKNNSQFNDMIPVISAILAYSNDAKNYVEHLTTNPQDILLGDIVDFPTLSDTIGK